jgi:hypothetical protein
LRCRDVDVTALKGEVGRTQGLTSVVFDLAQAVMRRVLVSIVLLL